MSDDKPREGLMGVGKWWFASAVFMLIVLTGLVLVLVSPGGGEDSEEAGPEKGETSEVASTPTDGSEGDGSESGFVTLPQPTKVTDGYPTHYPQTPEGAAATAAAFQVATGVLDYDQMYAALTAYTTELDDVRGYADGLVMVGRQTLDLPASGPPPAGVGVDVEVEGLKWREVDSTHTVVSLSSQVEYSLPDGTTRVITAAAPAPMVWAGGRWWLDGAAENSPKETYLEPGSAGFEAAGWKVLRNNDWLAGS